MLLSLASPLKLGFESHLEWREDQLWGMWEKTHVSIPQPVFEHRCSNRLVGTKMNEVGTVPAVMYDRGPGLSFQYELVIPALHMSEFREMNSFPGGCTTSKWHIRTQICSSQKHVFCPLPGSSEL